MLDHVVFHWEWGIREAQLLLDGGDLLGTQRGAVGSAGVHRVGSWVGDHGAQADEGGARGIGLGFAHGIENAFHVLAGDLEGLPAISLVALGDILGEGDGGLILDGDAVVIPEDDEVAQLLRAGQGARLGGDTFLHVAIGGNDVNEVVEDRLAGRCVRIEQCAFAAGGHGHAHGGS